MVTFQDSVGVNVEFQAPAPRSGYERSPFFPPIQISDSAGVERLQRFISRLEANSGQDQPENLAGALDFAANNVIGSNSNGTPNVIGDGSNDPKDVAPFPKLSNARRVFVAFTDAPFHADSRDSHNSSLTLRPASMAGPCTELTGTSARHPSWVRTQPSRSASRSLDIGVEHSACEHPRYSLIDRD